uniref:flocculation protein FLO11-like n=1 Tax=Erigeron canadensis TaxID=72917 RepID=UPI001CB9BDDC|nr:flocculation protein FLO11-like [Erigeron canadensis]
MAPGSNIPSSSSAPSSSHQPSDIPESSETPRKKQKSHHRSKSKSKSKSRSKSKSKSRSKSQSNTFTTPSPLTSTSSSSKTSPSSPNIENPPIKKCRIRLQSPLQPIPEETSEDAQPEHHDDVGDTEGGVENVNREVERSGLGTGQKENDGPPIVEPTSRDATTRIEAKDSPASHRSASHHSGSSQQDPLSSLHRHKPRPLLTPHSEDVDIETVETHASLPISIANTIKSRSPRSHISEHALSLNDATTDRELVDPPSQGVSGSPVHVFIPQVTLTSATELSFEEARYALHFRCKTPSPTGTLEDPGSPTNRNIVLGIRARTTDSETTNVEHLLHKSLGSPAGSPPPGHTVNPPEPTVVTTTSTSVVPSIPVSPETLAAVLRVEKGKAIVNPSGSVYKPPVTSERLNIPYDPAELELYETLDAFGQLHTKHTNPRPPKHSSPPYSFPSSSSSNSQPKKLSGPMPPES